MIHVSGLFFYDTNENISFHERDGSPYYLFGIENAPHHVPLPFIYQSAEVVNSFKIVKVNQNNQMVDTINLDTSLISSDGSYHKCSGLFEYTEVVQPNVYYFLVNDRYRSANFKVITIMQGVEYDIIECNLIVY